ncbi:DNA polymerase III subunit gamma/tau, partial [Ascidiaceihabitans sp.]|nr:DNA polymerase III subunit gamma/tau [Ascidiaceihabitans sp.]
AAEMAIIRLTHVADLPSPEELVRKLNNATPPPPPPNGGGNGGGMAPAQSGGGTTAYASAPAMSGGSSGGAKLALAVNADQSLARYPTFEHVIELIRSSRDVKLLVDLETTLQLAAYQPGRIEFVPADRAPRDMAQRLGAKLQQLTGNRWAVIVVNEGGAETIAKVRDAADNALQAKAANHPLVQAVLAQFPKAKIKSIRTPEQIAAEAVQDALPEVEDEWDPFEDD